MLDQYSRLSRQSSTEPLCRVLDIVERLLVLGLFVHFAITMTPRYFDLALAQWRLQLSGAAAAVSDTGALLLLASEAIAVGLVLVRRPAHALSMSPLDWVLAFAGSSAPLLARPADPGGLASLATAQTMMFAGLALQIWAKLALGRRFGVVPANRGISTGGPYRLVRHPIYAGYALTHFGFLLGYPSSYNTILYVSVALINLARLIREEHILEADPVYRCYAQSVRSRLIPYIY